MNTPSELGNGMGEHPWTVAAGDAGTADVPHDVRDAAYRAIHARVAGVVLPLAFDSVFGERRAGLQGTRHLRFEGSGFAVEATVEDGEGGLTASLVVAPPRAMTLAVRHGGGSTTLPLDRDGRCRVPVRSGPFSIVATPATGGAPLFETAWVSL
jgi:hypothetical protein